MILSAINCSTGPLGVTADVKRAFMNDPYSHRSKKFKQLLKNTTGFLSAHFKVANTYILTGSGTLANEAMLWQIKMLQTKGLILSNGEFGERLISQAIRIGIEHEVCQLEWGATFDAAEICEHMQQEDLKWVVLCHCETSTGIVNPLERLAVLCFEKGFKVFADCTSTVGTRMIDLSKVAMATCSSGKGLGSFPGLAIVLSNIFPAASVSTPVYADLYEYQSKKGIPFTISSNMLEALQTSMKQKMMSSQYELVAAFSENIRRVLGEAGLLVFEDTNSSVFTFHLLHEEFVNDLLRAGLIISYESGYLQKRRWGQLALFGYYTEEQLSRVMEILRRILVDSRQPTVASFEIVR